MGAMGHLWWVEDLGKVNLAFADQAGQFLECAVVAPNWSKTGEFLLLEKLFLKKASFQLGSKQKSHYRNDRGSRAVISWCWLTINFMLVLQSYFAFVGVNQLSILFSID